MHTGDPQSLSFLLLCSYQWSSYFIGAYLRSANLAQEGRRNKRMIENFVRQDDQWLATWWRNWSGMDVDVINVCYRTILQLDQALLRVQISAKIGMWPKLNHLFFFNHPRPLHKISLQLDSFITSWICPSLSLWPFISESWGHLDTPYTPMAVVIDNDLPREPLDFIICSRLTTAASCLYSVGKWDGAPARITDICRLT